MADNTQDLRIKITAEADNTGFKTAASAGQELKRSTTELSEATTEASAASEEHNKHLEGGGKVFTSLNKLVPELGHALHAAFMGPLGPIILVGLALAKVKEKLADYNAELDAVSDEQLAEHQQALKNLKTQWDAAQKSIGDYHAALATAGDEKDAIGKQLSNIKQLSDAQIEASKKISEQLGKQEVAYLRANGGSPEQIAAAEERSRRAGAALDAKGEAVAGVEGLKSEQAIRRDNNGLLQRRGAAALSAASSAAEELKKQQDELAAARARLDPTTEAGKKRAAEEAAANENLARIQNIQNIAPTPAARAALQGDVDAAGVEVARLNKLRELDQHHIQQLEAKSAELEKQKTILETRANEAIGASTVNQARLRELPGEIGQAGRVQAVRDHGRELINIINERDSRTGKSLDDYGHAANLQTSQILAIAEKLYQKTLDHDTVIAQLNNKINAMPMQAR